MLSLSKVLVAWHEQAQALQELGEQARAELTKQRQHLRRLDCEADPGEFNDRLTEFELSKDFSGALATEELRDGLFRNGPALSEATAVKAWQKRVLSGRPVAAVDGSQVEPDKNWGFGLGAVQVGWFVNYHDPSRAPDKDVDFEFILPQPQDSDLRREVACVRFQREAEKLSQLMRELSKAEWRQRPVVFFDNSLLDHGHFDPERRRRYQRALSDMLRASLETGIPVVGYVDTSLAYDLVRSLRVVYEGSQSGPKAYDAWLLGEELRAWGSRSALFEHYRASEGASEVGFAYVRTASDGAAPSRVEVPIWALREGILEEVVEVVLAEALVGNGYPYPLEVADSVAVLQQQERDKIVELISQRLLSSPKLASKRRRRRPSIRY
jgi:hypothetical protein